MINNEHFVLNNLNLPPMSLILDNSLSGCAEQRGLVELAVLSPLELTFVIHVKLVDLAHLQTMKIQREWVNCLLQHKIALPLLADIDQVHYLIMLLLQSHLEAVVRLCRNGTSFQVLAALKFNLMWKQQRLVSAPCFWLLLLIIE